jgi:two-component system sensor histidine kinase BaeS
MFKTLQRRFIASHMLPMLVVIPLMGIALIYALETQVLLGSLSHDLAEQASLVTEIAADQAEIWSDAAGAQAFVSRLEPRLSARLMLLDHTGQILASSDPVDADRLGQQLDISGLAKALQGQGNVTIAYSQRLHAEVVDVLAPVTAPDQQLLGIVRLTHRLGTLYEWFWRLRLVIAGVLIAGLLLGAVIGWGLALNLQHPLQQMTQAIGRLSSGQQLEALPKQGPEELRALASAFNTLVERLQTMEIARRRLLANLVHELGRPLGALLSAIQAMAGGADQDIALRRELLAGMEAEVQHLQRLLDDLAQLHDQVLGTLELDRRPTALAEWLPLVLSPWQQAAQGKGLHWQADIPAELPTITIDADRINQVLGNLLNNAIKYTSRGTIAVSAGLQGDQLWIRVDDTGPGIPVEEQENIFQPFYRGQSSRRFPQGLGLGLAIARDMVVAHGGQLEMESKPGMGSRFTIWLPRTVVGLKSKVQQQGVA